MTRSADQKRSLHTVLDRSSATEFAKFVVARSSITFSVMGKDSTTQLQLPQYELKAALVSAIQAHITSLPDADVHRRALAQLHVSLHLRSSGPHKRDLQYELHIHGRQSTLDLVAQHAFTPAQLGGFTVSVAGRSTPLILHRLGNSTYIHSYELVKLTCKDEVDPHRLCQLVLADSLRPKPPPGSRPLPVSPILGCKWAGLVEKAVSGFQLAWTDGPHGCSAPTPLPAWVSRQVQPGDVLALVGAYTADMWYIHYNPDFTPSNTEPPGADDKQVPVFLHRVQNLVPPPPYHPGSLSAATIASARAPTPLPATPTAPKARATPAMAVQTAGPPPPTATAAANRAAASGAAAPKTGALGPAATKAAAPGVASAQAVAAHPAPAQAPVDQVDAAKLAASVAAAAVATVLKASTTVAAPPAPVVTMAAATMGDAVPSVAAPADVLMADASESASMAVEFSTTVRVASGMCPAPVSSAPPQPPAPAWSAPPASPPQGGGRAPMQVDARETPPCAFSSPAAPASHAGEPAQCQWTSVSGARNCRHGDSCTPPASFTSPNSFAVLQHALDVAAPLPDGSSSNLEPPHKRQDLAGLASPTSPPGAPRTPLSIPKRACSASQSPSTSDKPRPRITLSRSRGRRRRRSASSARCQSRQPPVPASAAKTTADEYGTTPAHVVPEDANDTWEPMKVALLALSHPPRPSRPTTRSSSTASKPSRRLPTGLVFSRPGLTAAGSVDRQTWVATWLNQGQPRTALMDWVEQRCPFSSAQMPRVLLSIVQYIISECDYPHGSVDVTFRGRDTPCAFDAACAGMQPVGALPPHLPHA